MHFNQYEDIPTRSHNGSTTSILQFPVNEHYNSELVPQFDSQSYSQPSQYDFQSFPHHYPSHPYYSPTSFNPQFFVGQSQFPSHQSSQTSDKQPAKMQNKKKDQVQQRERNPNWTKE